MVFVCLYTTPTSATYRRVTGALTIGRRKQTHIWQPTVVAYSDLGLVGIDKDLGVTSGATTTIASDDAVVRPADRLLVNELYGGVGLGLPDGSC